MKYQIFLILLLQCNIVLVQFAYCQDSRMKITILDKCTDEVIPNVNFTITNLNTGSFISMEKFYSKKELGLSFGTYQIGKIYRSTFKPTALRDFEIKIPKPNPIVIYLEPIKGCAVTPSGENQSSFDSEQTITIITKEEIEASGITTIEELFYLVPGMVVQQQTNGNYDIHIRGSDNVSSGGLLLDAANTLTLVMIDNRVVYNNMTGGIFWETLPINIYDIEQVEIIRGPASTLYGANAATGAINIITKKGTENSPSFVLGGQVGSKITPVDEGVKISNLAVVDLKAAGFIQKSFIRRSSIRYSGFYKNFNRFQDNYYSYRENKYVPSDSIVFASRPEPISFDPNRLKNVSKSRDNNWAINLAHTTYLNTEKADSSHTFEVDLGYQNSDAQVAYNETLATPIGHRKSKTGYVNIAFNPKSFSEQGAFKLQGAYRTGIQDLFPGTGRLNYQMDVLQLGGDLKLKKIEKKLFKFEIKIGGNYQFVKFKGIKSKFPENIGREFFQGAKTINYFAPYTRFEQTFSSTQRKEILKLVLGLRWDVFTGDIKDNFPTIQSFLLYKPTVGNVFRFNFSSAKRTHFFLNNFLDFSDGERGRTPTVNRFLGNQGLENRSVNHFEIGVRNQLYDNDRGVSISSDLDIFSINSKEYTTFNVVSQEQELIDTIFTTTNVIQIQNAKISTKQLGFTANLSLSLDLARGKLNSGLFMTIQNTTIKDSNSSYKHEWSPDSFGGIFVRYKANNGFKFFLNSYYIANRKYIYNAIPALNRIDSIKSKLLTNINASIPIGNNIEVSLNLRNVNLLFNGVGRDFGFTDQILPLLLIGFKLYI